MFSSRDVQQAIHDCRAPGCHKCNLANRRTHTPCWRGIRQVAETLRRLNPEVKPPRKPAANSGHPLTRSPIPATARRLCAAEPGSQTAQPADDWRPVPSQALTRHALSALASVLVIKLAFCPEGAAVFVADFLFGGQVHRQNGLQAGWSRLSCLGAMGGSSGLPSTACRVPQQIELEEERTERGIPVPSGVVESLKRLAEELRLSDRLE